jgi:hypothetical protein
MRDDDVLATQERVAIGDLEGLALIGNPSGSGRRAAAST